MILNTKSTNYKEGINKSKKEMSPHIQESKLNNSLERKEMFFFQIFKN